MGLTIDVFAFSHPPPSYEELRAHVRAFAGSDWSLDALDVEPAEKGYRDMPFRAKLLCMQDHKTRSYACAFLVAHGGVPVDHGGGQRRALALPTFVERPWRAWPLWRRIRFRLGLARAKERVSPVVAHHDADRALQRPHRRVVVLAPRRSRRRRAGRVRRGYAAACPPDPASAAP